MLSLPAGVGFCLLGRPLLELIYFARPQDCTLGAPLLTILGPGVFFVAMTTMTNAILQAMGRMRTPVYTLAAGALCKLGVTYVLTGKPTVHIGGAPLGHGVLLWTDHSAQSAGSSPGRDGGFLG